MEVNGLVRIVFLVYLTITVSALTDTDAIIKHLAAIQITAGLLVNKLKLYQNGDYDDRKLLWQYLNPVR